MSAYTDADHFAAAEAILANFNPPDEKHGSWWINPGVSATAVLDTVAPAIAARAKADALRHLETTFRKMARAGYNAEIVSGIEGCADLIADRLFCSEFRERTP